jgi:hypothetical protein
MSHSPAIQPTVMNESVFNDFQTKSAVCLLGHMGTEMLTGQRISPCRENDTLGARVY